MRRQHRNECAVTIRMRAGERQAAESASTSNRETAMPSAVLRSTTLALAIARGLGLAACDKAGGDAYFKIICF